MPPKKNIPTDSERLFPPLWGVWKTLGNLSTHTVGRWILTRVRVCAAEWIEKQSDLCLKPPCFSSYKTWVDQTDFWRKPIDNTNDLAKAPWNPHLHKKTKTFLERGSGVTKWRSSGQNWELVYIWKPMWWFRTMLICNPAIDASWNFTKCLFQPSP